MIDHLRQERSVFEGIHKKLQRVSDNLWVIGTPNVHVPYSECRMNAGLHIDFHTHTHIHIHTCAHTTHTFTHSHTHTHRI